MGGQINGKVKVLKGEGKVEDVKDSADEDPEAEVGIGCPLCGAVFDLRTGKRGPVGMNATCVSLERTKNGRKKQIRAFLGFPSFVRLFCRCFFHIKRLSEDADNGASSCPYYCVPTYLHRFGGHSHDRSQVRCACLKMRNQKKRK